MGFANVIEYNKLHKNLLKSEVPRLFKKYSPTKLAPYIQSQQKEAQVNKVKFISIIALSSFVTKVKSSNQQLSTTLTMNMSRLYT